MIKTAKETIDATITHKAFLQMVSQYARLNGWLVYSTWRSIHSPPGYPDLTMARGVRLVFAELKTKRDKPTPEQAEWLSVLRATGTCEVYLLYPKDWEFIEMVLGRE
jgi:hypothetical protein